MPADEAKTCLWCLNPNQLLKWSNLGLQYKDLQRCVPAGWKEWSVHSERRGKAAAAAAEPHQTPKSSRLSAKEKVDRRALYLDLGLCKEAKCLFLFGSEISTDLCPDSKNITCMLRFLDSPQSDALLWRPVIKPEFLTHPAEVTKASRTWTLLQHVFFQSDHRGFIWSSANVVKEHHLIKSSVNN